MQFPGKMDEEVVNDRYRHLLQPLRDVSTNWECNIKDHLDDYLEKLRHDRERNAIAVNGEPIK
jgi:hypothetical protein